MPATTTIATRTATVRPCAKKIMASESAARIANSGRTSGPIPAVNARISTDAVEGLACWLQRIISNQSSAIQKMTRQVSSPEVAKSRAGGTAI